MLTRIFAAAAFATLTVGAAQAGTISSGVWTPSCPNNPGAAPVMDGHNQASYTKSAKDYQAWADKAQAYQQCVSNEAKADQNAVVEGANKTLTQLNDGAKAFKEAADAAMEKLKGAAKKSSN
jgi:hypothetical protein